MGLFSDIFSQKKTTSVNVPSWIKKPLTNYTGAVNDYVNSDPTQYVAPASQLQNLAFGQAANLGEDWRGPMTGALDATIAAGAAPAANAGLAAQTSLAQTNPAAQATASGYQAPRLGTAGQAAGVTIAPTQQIAGQSLLDNFSAYQDPAISELVDTSMANYDRESAQRRAQEQARMAGNGAWGSGGRFYMSNFDQATSLGGAQLEAQLRAAARAQAIAASISDADRRQGAAGFNAGQYNTRAANQGQLTSTNNMFNTGQGNDFRVAQGGFNAQAGQFNANAQNVNSMFNAGQTNDMGMFNTGQANQVGMYNTGQTNDMSQYNAGLQNDQLDRALQAALGQGNIANMIAGNSRGDTALVGQLGQDQWMIDQAMAQALPTQLMNAGQMYGNLNLPSYAGNTVTGTPSPFNVAMGLGSMIPWGKKPGG